MWWFLLVCATRTYAEVIGRLPGTEKLNINFTQHSGYLAASDTHFFFYWFIESGNKPDTDPLIIWFSGGPGCSSMEAVLNEIGPFEFNSDGTLRLNPYSWHKNASIVFIDSPVDVGFSYHTEGHIPSFDDTKTTEDNYRAIMDFFRQYPKFRDCPLYLMGESYAGIYVPLLAHRILQSRSENRLNINGIALGNAYLHEALIVQTSLIFAYERALVDQNEWDDFLESCCGGCIENCDFKPGGLSKKCLGDVNNIYESLWNSGLNPFDIYRDCVPNADNIRLLTEKYGLQPKGYNFFGSDEELFLESMRKLVGGSPLLFGKSCINDSLITNYLNDQKTRKALHIPDSYKEKWLLCNPKVVKNYKKEFNDMSQWFTDLLVNYRLRILLYYGDTDMICNFLMGQRFAYRLNLTIMGNEKKNWHLHGHAGFQTNYYSGSTTTGLLTFLTVRGGGHMAAQWRAPQVFHAVRQFTHSSPIL